MKKAGLSSIPIAVVLLAVGAIAEAQQPGKIPRIGLLLVSTPSATAHLVEAFRQGLRQRGYVEGQNITTSNPVTFLPGRARLATKPSAIGSPVAVITMGIVRVACWAADINDSVSRIERKAA
jgi:hypothetical protein